MLNRRAHIFLAQLDAIMKPVREPLRKTSQPVRAFVMAFFALILAACEADISPPGGSSGDSASNLKRITKVTAARIIAADTEPQNWLAHGRTYSEQRFSPLASITDENVSRLGLAWSYEMGTHRGLEATPLVVDGIMYTTGTWSVIYALEAATGRLLWKYDPQVPRAWGPKGCCDVVNRGVALWNDRLYSATFDGRLLALDSATGKLIWEKNTIDRSKPYTITGAPRIINGHVIIGNGGAEFGVRGYVSAYDSQSGELVWRFYTVPGSAEGPFEQPELALAVKTWDPSGTWPVSGGGGTVWDSMAYDPDLDILYVGTGNGYPHARHVRSPAGGDNLFLSSIIALNPNTGEMLWYYQTTPADNWDYTATQHMILTELVIDGIERKVLMQAPKNGFFYVLDRTTGELLSADKYVFANWASHVDLATGRPIETGQGDSSREDKLVYPSEIGGHNWQPMSFSPQTGLVYFPAVELPWVHSPENFYVFDYEIPNIEALRSGQPEVDQGGYLKAWDPVKRQIAWQVKSATMTNGGVLSTAGNLVFQGTEDGFLKAYRATDGVLLHSLFLGSSIIAPPISYSIDGIQYVAIMAGFGGAMLGITDDNSATHIYGNNGYIHVFKLGGEKPAPPPEKPPEKVLVAAREPVSEEILERGNDLYRRNCGFCHGMSGSRPILPDLRYMTPEIEALLKDIVLEGLFIEKGMPSFAGVLTEADLDAIHAAINQASMKLKALNEEGKASTFVQ